MGACSRGSRACWPGHHHGAAAPAARAPLSALLRFEINIRASAILGFVGAGGIGYELKNAMAWGIGRYDQAAAIFLLLFITIVAVDQIGSALRDRLTHGSRKDLLA